MIVIGVDVHKRSLTAVAVDEVGRPLAEHSAVDGPGLLEWVVSLPAERLWALEDCRQLTRQLERQLLAADERLVRVPPKLTAPAPRRPNAREVGPDRRARRRQGGTAGAAARSPAAAGDAAARVKAAGSSAKKQLQAGQHALAVHAPARRAGPGSRSGP
jgi:hypothetical protein